MACMASKAPAPKAMLGFLVAANVLWMAAFGVFVGFLATRNVVLMRISAGVFALGLIAFARSSFLLRALLAADPGAHPGSVGRRSVRSQRVGALFMLLLAAYLLVVAIHGV